MSILFSTSRLALCGLLAFSSFSAGAEAPPLKAYGSLPVLEDAAISQDGSQIALGMVLDGKRQITVFDPQLQPLRTLAFGDTKMRSFDWIGNDALIATYSRTEELPFGYVGDKLEVFKALVIPEAEGDEVYSIFSGRRDVMDAVFGSHGVRQVDGRWTGYFEGLQFRVNSSGVWRFNGGHPSLYAVDMASGKTKVVSQPASESMWRDWLIDADGTVAATLDFHGNTGDWIVVNARGQTVVSGNNADGRVRLLAFGKDGDTLVYSQTVGGRLEPLRFEVPLNGGTPVEFLPDADVQNLYIDRLTGRVTGHWNNGSVPRPVFFDPARQAAMQRLFGSLGQRKIEIKAMSGDYNRAVLRLSGNADPGTWYLLDLQSSRPISLGSERPGIPADQVGPVRTFPFTAADGLEMDGILTLPPGKEGKNLPLVMLPHGGPASHDVADFDWWAQAFASRGYAVFQPNFRGSTNRGEAFRAAGDGEWGRKMQTDLSDAIAALAKDGIVDPDRACIMGASYGGYAALAGVTIQQGQYRCAVAVAPVSDLSLMYQATYQEANVGGVARRMGEKQLGPRNLFDLYSPRQQAAKADAPILLIHGLDDTVVPFNHSAVMAAALKTAGKPHQLVQLPGEDHWLSRPETRLRMLEEAMSFVQKHNPAE